MLGHLGMEYIRLLALMSSVMRKPAFCLYENKGADQLLCFRYINRTIYIYFLNHKF